MFSEEKPCCGTKFPEMIQHSGLLQLLNFWATLQSDKNSIVWKTQRKNNSRKNCCFQKRCVQTGKAARLFSSKNWRQTLAVCRCRFHIKLLSQSWCITLMRLKLDSNSQKKKTWCFSEQVARSFVQVNKIEVYAHFMWTEVWRVWRFSQPKKMLERTSVSEQKKKRGATKIKFWTWKVNPLVCKKTSFSKLETVWMKLQCEKHCRCAGTKFFGAKTTVVQCFMC